MDQGRQIPGPGLRLLAVLLLAAPVACEPPPPSAASTASKSLPSWEVSFSPRGGCTEAVVAALGKARSSVVVQAYSFTSAPIAKALVDAHRRGVKVEVILDKSQRTEKYSSADFVAHAGIPTLIDAKHAIAHNKVMVIDGETVVTGSFNFTKAAEESNAENLLVIQDPQLAKKYAENWSAHAQHSESYAGRGSEPEAPLLKPREKAAEPSDKNR
jgi:phosphatidylserine/phosphatidylglycerophosphate/cardiolipin synthase-like enzyme